MSDIVDGAGGFAITSATVAFISPSSGDFRLSPNDTFALKSFRNDS